MTRTASRLFDWLALGAGAVALVAAAGCGKTAIPQDPADSGPPPSCTWFRDSDQDGYGDPSVTLERCDQPAGYVDNDLDCDDTDAALSPDTEWHPDADADGYGDAGTTVTRCVRPADHLLDGSDCDDQNDAVNPETVWYADADMDGFGDSSVSLAQCTQPPGYVLSGGDCDDTDQMILPGTVWHPDADGDGYGDATMMRVQCARPAGHVLDGTDCDDADAAQHPGQVWHLDFDADGFGHPGVTMVACATPATHVLDGRDCDDMDAMVYPGRGSCPFTPAMATSCLDILTDGNSEGDGAYVIDPDGAGGAAPYTVHCDMTTDGGGWTALLNPAGMPTPTIPGVVSTWAHVSGFGSSCDGNPHFWLTNGWYTYGASDCDTYTNAYTLDWPNAFAASDVMFTASLQGEVTHTLAVDGAVIASDASSSPGVCQFYNATGAGLPPGTPLSSCHAVWLTAPPAIHLDSFTGALTVVVTVGPGCSATTCYGSGFNLHHLFVR